MKIEVDTSREVGNVQSPPASRVQAEASETLRSYAEVGSDLETSDEDGAYRSNDDCVREQANAGKSQLGPQGYSVASDMNSSAVDVEDSNESSENYHADETSDDGRGSDDDDTGVENCQERVVLREFPGSPVARDTVLGDSAHAPVGSLGGLKEPQTGGFSLPTPASDHASDSGKGGQIVTRERKRDFGTTGGVCENLKLQYTRLNG
ncbi:hypothetical protein CH63R_10615 [Colletotrichum higginsianum IMI 349063]|uniref:Uncharacterized protein n=1 Tax=Colletotrichum higginsianum (strain IMI 349063) TaxID=759273 RepID=A0A1B7Y3F5_COLHI|nr:uncharacterized protein CH63R_10615 [Colletotrichum higginsianum IMI 349063]OBR06495.1 hypothetical protein CH63R_10615 [Colletotrichum higginsianum IMI 349063]